MSSYIKRTLNDLTNEKNKRLKNDSAIDLNFDIGELQTRKSQSSYSTSTSSESLFEDDSMIDDDDVFEDEQNVTGVLLKTSQNQGRKRLNATSTYRTKENKNKRKSKTIKKQNVIVDQALNQLRDEQARIDGHSLSITAK